MFLVKIAWGLGSALLSVALGGKVPEGFFVLVAILSI
jgi:hypothetical protein